MIATWKQDLTRVLQIFNVRSVNYILYLPTTSIQTELAINTHVMVADIHRNAFAGQEGPSGQHRVVSDSHSLRTGYSSFHRLQLLG